MAKKRNDGPQRKRRDPYLAAVGAAIRQLRVLGGMSQEGLAESCALHRTYIGSVERGERNVSVQNLQRIAQALGVSAAELLRRAEDLPK